jgi:hypothetical protein
VKTGLHNCLRAAQRDRVAPDTGPMTGSSNYQQPSTIRGEAHLRSGGEIATDRVLFVCQAVFRAAGEGVFGLEGRTRLCVGRRVVAGPGVA